ncbi:MAG TPA: peptide chain release factor N(5)-glutamine methyltransferase [Gammaproteobacteria bacterium]|nr:peptide chain release factor N(5)-glutamine methyltransferase [Gammaproteobacteria bacterium]
MITLAMALRKAHDRLRSSSDTPSLDAEVLLADVLHVSRSHLFAFPERVLTRDEMHAYENRIRQRAQRVPVAYLTNHQEFWSLDFLVTRDTLIPRPETELLVQLALKENHGEKKTVADIGTGSGAIALAIAHECPLWEVHATDISEKALAVARSNAKRLGLSSVFFHEGDWLLALPPDLKFDVIVSNPPYLAEDDPHLHTGELHYEPRSALVSGENGLKAIREVATGARHYLKSGGRVWLEHGCEQAKEIRSIFENLGYSEIESHQDMAGLDRVTGGRL